VVSNGPERIRCIAMDPKTNESLAIEVGKRPLLGWRRGSAACGCRCARPPNVENGAKPGWRASIQNQSVGGDHSRRCGNSEGGIAASLDAVWLTTDIKGVLSRIDPATKVAAEIEVAPGRWPVCLRRRHLGEQSEKSVVTRVDAKTNKSPTHPVGPKPRFITAGAGSVWTLNQGDGTVSRVDTKSRKL